MITLTGLKGSRAACTSGQKCVGEVQVNVCGSTEEYSEAVIQVGRGMVCVCSMTAITY